MLVVQWFIGGFFLTDKSAIQQPLEEDKLRDISQLGNEKSGSY